MERVMVREVCGQGGESASDRGVGFEANVIVHPAPHARLRILRHSLNSERQQRKHKRVTFYLPVELVEDLRNVVYWTRGVTLAGLVEEALNDTLRRRQEAQGGPFPSRQGPLKGGRPRRRG